MAHRTRRRRSRPRRGLSGLLIPVIIGLFSVFVATHYAVDWGKDRANGAATLPVVSDTIARAEDVVPTEPTPTATIAVATQLPTRPLPTSPPAPTALPRISVAPTASLPIAGAPGPMAFTPDFAL